MRIRNIPRNIPIRTRRVLNWQKNSAPYISGDFFADISDFSFYGPPLRIPNNEKNIEEAETIFCPSHLYEELISDFGYRINASTLILGNSDRDFEGPLENLPKSIKTVYRQNSTFNNETYKLLPIGLENIRLGQNGRKFLFDQKYSVKSKFSKVLIGPFTPTHPDRLPLLKLDAGNPKYFDVLKGRINPKKYAEISSQYKFIAAPRGNGLDTHRFWEALYRGSYPIVIKTAWSDTLERLGVPLITISAWNVEELERVSKLVLPNFNPCHIEIIWSQYWLKAISHNY